MARKTVFTFLGCLLVVLLTVQVATAGPLDGLLKEAGRSFGRQLAKDMAADQLRKMARNDPKFADLLRTLEAGNDVCDQMDEEYGPGTCKNVVYKLGDKCHHIVNAKECQEIVNGPRPLRASQQKR